MKASAVVTLYHTEHQSCEVLGLAGADLPRLLGQPNPGLPRLWLFDFISLIQTKISPQSTPLGCCLDQAPGLFLASRCVKPSRACYSAFFPVDNFLVPPDLFSRASLTCNSRERFRLSSPSRLLKFLGNQVQSLKFYQGGGAASNENGEISSYSFSRERGANKALYLHTKGLPSVIFFPKNHKYMNPQDVFQNWTEKWRAWIQNVRLSSHPLSYA